MGGRTARRAKKTDAVKRTRRLRDAGGDRERTAVQLGLAPHELARRIETLGLQPGD